MSFEVALDLPHLEPIGAENQILFHAINKSGSQAVSDVLFRSFEAEEKGDRFKSHFRMDVSQESFIKLIDEHKGGGFFIDHYLYGWVKPKPNRIMLSQFRHPLPKILSAYQWLKTRHERNNESAFPSLTEFVARTQGKSHSIVVQFGTNWVNVGSAAWLAKLEKLTATELFERSLEAIDRELYAVGIAEHFEESLFLYAKLCGLEKLLPWVRDIRNPGRPLSNELDPSSVQLIEEVMHLDYKLYAFALEKFWAQFRGATFGPSLQAYKVACIDQYNDRII